MKAMAFNRYWWSYLALDLDTSVFLKTQAKKQSWSLSNLPPFYFISITARHFKISISCKLHCWNILEDTFPQLLHPSLNSWIRTLFHPANITRCQNPCISLSFKIILSCLLDLLPSSEVRFEAIIWREGDLFQEVPRTRDSLKSFYPCQTCFAFHVRKSFKILTLKKPMIIDS